ncbi:hypothetical protein THASP1DRAFT_25865, partial [Thamnocephalis sphaerospora]
MLVRPPVSLKRTVTGVLLAALALWAPVHNVQAGCAETGYYPTNGRCAAALHGRSFHLLTQTATTDNGTAEALRATEARLSSFWLSDRERQASTNANTPSPFVCAQTCTSLISAKCRGQLAVVLQPRTAATILPPANAAVCSSTWRPGTPVVQCSANELLRTTPF